ncbi:peptide chain release factor N(5)-glutamine methyltransferase [Synechococcus sp. CS-1324]|uniref:peptide chain release factor N(5)-glutamine methyltransferase n=1 Tax=Synechococcus sp. CS-1324 TaxID=2847980 RepID=UPI000DB77EE4|nr:peptide chain release factor N(5)-glutamine methyltransferase [Synechococcus sp. CS-1324]MCT0231883.1 peptide chain release factor N(5)-glutamine methyltransferase [Synechococcus sp. CS-1324]PZV03665.1 MAG: peptide chain release factor N(5)-glutamine methyltransferase [Cyanobium sp.]
MHASAEETLSGAGLLAWRRALLLQGGLAANFDWLLDLAGGLDGPARQRLWLDPHQPVPLHRSRADLEALWFRHRRDHTPLQYLVGRCPWRDFDVQVGPGVLIPRPETEQLIDLAVEAMGPAALKAPLRWADLGTGSGCLALALSRLLPASRGVAVDFSAAALLQAEANLQAADLLHRVDLREGCWWSPLEPLDGGLDLVVSNPPYIPSPLLPCLDPVVRLHEPWLALDGGEDGLEALRQIIQSAGRALAPGGWLLLEHHHDQGESVRGLLAAAGLEQVGSHQDLEGRCRFSGARHGEVPSACYR